jgi:hypothetical protein
VLEALHAGRVGYAVLDHGQDVWHATIAVRVLGLGLAIAGALPLSAAARPA